MIVNHLVQLLGQNSDASVAVGAGALILVIGGIALIGTIFVIWMLVDCLTSSMPTNEKILWALVIIFLHLVGAIIYFAVKRSNTRGTGIAT